MGPTGPNIRVLQIHPSRRCNLRCLHCYSQSGPEERESLDPALLERAIAAAAHAGFNTLGVSGGEPLLYPGLRRVLECAHANGMITTVTTNGMLLDARRLAVLEGAADLLAISLDGLPDSHNQMRNSPDAFPRMASRLAGLRATGIPFGFIFTLTQYNLHELDWVADFAVEQGAALLQIHPLEDVGRAAECLPGARPDAIEAGYAYLEARRLREQLGDRITIQLDYVPRALVRREPERVLADPVAIGHDQPLSELVAPLVIEPDGEVVPLEYGFPRRYSIGNLHSAPLEALDRAWRQERAGSFRELCRRMFAEEMAAEATPLFNWYERIGAFALARDQPVA